MFKVPLKKPSPDFEALEKLIKGEKESDRVHFVELLVDPEMMEYIVKNYMNGTVDRDVMRYIQGLYASKSSILTSEETRQRYQRQMVDFSYKMGYDFVRVGSEYTNLPQFKARTALDTAGLSRGKRNWVEQAKGVINCWDDFKKIDWDEIKPHFGLLAYAQNCLPDGMKIVVASSLFEMILERLLGYENLFIFSQDEPELVEAVFKHWGRKVYEFYREAVRYPEVGAIFHGDDLGYKTGTMLSPDFLRQNVFPWFKKYASLAHEQGKTFWLHSCGNLTEIMEDLIEDVGIDALHSFEDSCCSVIEYKRKYGERIGILGGIDMDKLARMNESELRKYVREILDECMPTRYALGSGNTIANYIPPENYLIMLDEGLRWQPQ